MYAVHAAELGVVPMALYKHVANKDQLLDGMVDLVLGDIDEPDADLDWQSDVRQRVLSARRAVLRHPWARKAIESRTHRTPVVLGHMDALAGTFRAGGFSADLTHHVMHALGNRMWGFSPELFDAPPSSAPPSPEEQEAMARAFAERFPHILEIAVAETEGDLSGVGHGCDEQFEFEFALDLLLDGFDRLRARGWSSRARETPSSRDGSARLHAMSSRSWLSLASRDSALSIASEGSFLSIGSVGSFLSVGSVGSSMSLFSAGSWLSIGSALSSRSVLSVLSDRSVGATRAAGCVAAVAVLALVAGRRP